MSKIKLSENFIRNTVKLSLNEDLFPSGDITSNLVESNKIIKVKLLSNQDAVIGGLLFAKHAFSLIDKKIKFIIKKKDGSFVKKKTLIATIQGNAKNILIAERVALNYLSHISGIATKIGGGTNHRFNLSDEYLIKDNHIASSSIKLLVSLAIKMKKGKKITVEVDNLKQLRQIIGLRFNTVLFDNMNIKNLKAGVKIAKKYYETEASGNVSLKNIKAIASTGVDRISVGSITHSAPAIDFKMEI